MGSISYIIDCIMYDFLIVFRIQKRSNIFKYATKFIYKDEEEKYNHKIKIHYFTT